MNSYFHKYIYWYRPRLGLNTCCHSNSVSFKSHSISVTFKFCAVRIALSALEPRSTDSLGTQHQNLNVTLIEWHQVFTPYMILISLMWYNTNHIQDHTLPYFYWGVPLFTLVFNEETNRNEVFHAEPHIGKGSPRGFLSHSIRLIGSNE